MPLEHSNTYFRRDTHHAQRSYSKTSTHFQFQVRLPVSIVQVFQLTNLLNLDPYIPSDLLSPHNLTFRARFTARL